MGQCGAGASRSVCGTWVNGVKEGVLGEKSSAVEETGLLPRGTRLSRPSANHDSFRQGGQENRRIIDTIGWDSCLIPPRI